MPFLNTKISRPPTRFQSTICACVVFVAGVLVLAGCHKQTPAAQIPAAPTAAESATAPSVAGNPAQNSPAVPVVIAASPDGGADLKSLNHAYIGWIVQNHKRPKSFEEYVTASGVQVPPAPAGKKNVIDRNGFINLANN